MSNAPSEVTENQPSMVWVRLCALTALPSNKAIGFSIGGQRLVLARCGTDSAQVLQGLCPHMGVPLDKAQVKDCAVTCWLHQSTFSVADGSVIKWTTVERLQGPALEAVKAKNALHTFETRIANGDVQLHWPGQPGDTIDVRISI